MPLRGYEAEGLSLSNFQTLEEVAKSDCVITVAQLKSRGQEENVIAAVQLLLCDFLDNLNLRSSMNNNQIAIASKLMVEEHIHLPFPHAFKLFFKDAMCGKFGAHYGRIDIQTLMMWLQQFENSYFEMVEERAYQEHQSNKGDNANFVDILQKHKALEGDEDKPVPMPEHMFVEYKQKRLRKEIADRVHKQNAHLYSQMSVQEADRIIDKLIQDELKRNNLTNQN